MRNLLFLICLLAGIAAHSQHVEDVFPSETTGVVEGSQYFSDDFISAKLDGFDPMYMIRYNAYQDYVEVKTANGKISKFEPSEKMRVVSTDKKNIYVYLFYDNAMGFLNEIASLDKVSIYQRNRKYLQAESAASNGYSSYRPAIYKTAESKYYIRIKDAQLVEMPTGKKDFARLFGDKEADVTAYLKANKLSLSKNDDLKKLAEYLNSIL
ncbi:MAG: hypothetical protein EOO48_04705 [Flavobacterium sp.]|nr:MAG: hypothetical protein EOO48_04705 [Flavobacterium sp.]